MKAFHEIRNYASDFMVWQASYENIGFLAHWHQELELISIRSGEARFSIGDDDFTAHAGDLVLVDTGDFHYSDSFGRENCLDFILFDPSIISPHYHHSHFASPLVTARQLAQYGMQEEARHLFETVGKELRETQPYYREIVSARLCDFFFHLRRFHPCTENSDTARSHHMEMLDDLQHLLTYIDEHYGEDISLGLAASKMNFSESHFSKIFKQLVGINFVPYLNAVRIEHAAAMLRNSGARVSEIALACGFANIRSFNRTFKDYTGCTPTAFMALTDSEAQHFSYYKRKSHQKEYVQNDSLTLVKNPA